VGEKLENGTWTGPLGQIQSGHIDTFTVNAYITLERFDSFLFTTPYVIEKYAVLMKRPNKFFIDYDSLTVYIDASVYFVTFALLLLLFLIAWLNEQRPHIIKRNCSWRLFLSLSPMNGQMWPNQVGVTRKVLMTTIGFATLIITQMYQAKQAETTMIPYSPPIVTLRDIENSVDSGRAKLIFTYDNSPLYNYITNVSTIFAHSLISNPPIYTAIKQLDAINTQNGIYIEGESAIRDVLREIPPHMCNNYVFMRIDEWARGVSALIMQKGRKEMLEEMNAIVAERMSYVDEYIRSFHIEPQCGNEIFYTHMPELTFAPLQLAEIGATLLFTLVFLCLAVIVLLAEVLLHRWHCRSKSAETTAKHIFEMNIRYDDTLSIDTRRIIEAKYFDIIDAIQRDKRH
jgi:hypothetical protein